MSEEKLLEKIRNDARKIAKRFGLKYADIVKESRRVRSRYGSCDEDRLIRIRLHNLGNGKYLKYTNLILTLCHELAHVKYMDHGKKFKELEKNIIKWTKKSQIHRKLSRGFE